MPRDLCQNIFHEFSTQFFTRHSLNPKRSIAKAGFGGCCEHVAQVDQAQSGLGGGGLGQLRAGGGQTDWRPGWPMELWKLTGAAADALERRPGRPREAEAQAGPGRPRPRGAQGGQAGPRGQADREAQAQAQARGGGKDNQGQQRPAQGAQGLTPIEWPGSLCFVCVIAWSPSGWENLCQGARPSSNRR